MTQPITHENKGPPRPSQSFNRYRLVVDITIDDATYTDSGVGPARNNVVDSLGCEIVSNLEWLPGVRLVSVKSEPAGTPVTSAREPSR